jgi:hypothetical protein
MSETYLYTIKTSQITQTLLGARVWANTEKCSAISTNQNILLLNLTPTTCCYNAYGNRNTQQGENNGNLKLHVTRKYDALHIMEQIYSNHDTCVKNSTTIPDNLLGVLGP